MTIRNKFLNFMKPISEFVGKLHMPFTHKMITGKDYYKVFPLLKSGQIFLTKKRGEISNLFIKGDWTHAAILDFNPSSVFDEAIIEAIGEGVVRTDLITFFTSKDYIMILEPKDTSIYKEILMGKALQYARSQLGKPYDYEFDFNINQKAFYCSELVWWSYFMACKDLGVDNVFICKDKILGEEAIEPQDIAELDTLKIVWDSRKKQ